VTGPGDGPGRRGRISIGSFGRAAARATLPPRPEQQPELGAELGAVRRWIHGALFDNLGLKFLSIVLAITVFLLVNTDRDREISARVGVSYTLPQDKVLVSDRVDDVRVTIKGPWQRLRKFDERELDRINLDLRRAPSGDIALTPDLVHLPSGLTVEAITPRTVHVAWDRRVDKLVEVTPQVTGRPQHGYVVSESKTVPATVKVRGAEGTLAALLAVRTREVSVEGRTESFTEETEAEPPDGVELVGGPQVLLHVAIDEELVSRNLPGLSVVPRGDGVEATRLTVRPAQVDVTLTGALLAVEKAKTTLVPFVKVGLGDAHAREANVSIDGVPPGIGVKVSPERVTVAPAKAP
jgi:YbbR domain-containing protein